MRQSGDVPMWRCGNAAMRPDTCVRTKTLVGRKRAERARYNPRGVPMEIVMMPHQGPILYTIKVPERTLGLDFSPYKSQIQAVRQKRLGRPFKTGKPLSERVELRLTTDELRNLKAKAKRAGLSVSEFLRQFAKD